MRLPRFSLRTLLLVLVTLPLMAYLAHYELLVRKDDAREARWEQQQADAMVAAREAAKRGDVIWMYDSDPRPSFDLPLHERLLSAGWRLAIIGGIACCCHWLMARRITFGGRRSH